MTIQLTPFKTGGVQRGAACQVMDQALSDAEAPAGTGSIQHVYTSANMETAPKAFNRLRPLQRAESQLHRAQVPDRNRVQVRQ